MDNPIVHQLTPEGVAHAEKHELSYTFLCGAINLHAVATLDPEQATCEVCIQNNLLLAAIVSQA